jgi:hypothetical protein
LLEITDNSWIYPLNHKGSNIILIIFISTTVTALDRTGFVFITSSFALLLYIYVQNDFTDVISNPVIYDTSNISLTTVDHGLHIHVQTHIVDIIFVLFIILFSNHT